jgi:geranylgeranyl diphosphate synthase type I
MGQTLQWGDDLLERLEVFAGSGKRLRGGALCWTYEAFSGQKPSGAVFDAAAALELTHGALLIHDDIMDEDETRRGRPSMHEQYRRLAAEQGLSGASRVGINLAMAVGDAAIFLAFGLLDRAREACDDHRFHGLFVEQLLETCGGQMQDVYLEARPAMPSHGDIHDMMRAKTAAYTLALPLAMGAAMAGQPAPVIDRLKAIGTAGGTIFQIRDDELGALGDPARTGKPVGSDIKEGKKTLFHYHLLRSCGGTERKRLGRIFGNPDVSEREIAYVQKLAGRLGISEILAEEIKDLYEEAAAHIGLLKADKAVKEELGSLLDFCARRRY